MAAPRDEARRQALLQLLDQGTSMRVIALRFGVSTQAVYQMLARIENDQPEEQSA